MRLAPCDFTLLRRLARRQVGIQLDDCKDALIEARLLPIVYRDGYDSLEGLVEALTHRPTEQLRCEVSEALLNHETCFFRDKYPFEALRTRVLPELIERRSGSRCLKVWSAACASGQEPYSLAMLLAEHFPETQHWQLDLLASDVSQTALLRARKAVYQKLEIARGLPAALRAKYFHQRGDSWQLSEKLRSRVAFRTLNLVQPWSRIEKMDLILMRNVLLYFDRDTRRAVLSRLRRHLKPDGILLLGVTETPRCLENGFERLRFNQSLFYRPRGEGSGP